MRRKSGPRLKTRLLALLAALAIFTVATAQTPSYDPNGTLTFVTNADPTLNPWTPGAVIE